MKTVLAATVVAVVAMLGSAIGIAAYSLLRPTIAPGWMEYAVIICGNLFLCVIYAGMGENLYEDAVKTAMSLLLSGLLLPTSPVWGVALLTSSMAAPLANLGNKYLHSTRVRKTPPSHADKTE